jgi:hypothetical protein
MTVPNNDGELLKRAFGEKLLRKYARQLGLPARSPINALAEQIARANGIDLAVIELNRLEADKTKTATFDFIRKQQLYVQIVKWAYVPASLLGAVAVSLVVYFGFSTSKDLVDALKVRVETAVKQSESATKQSEEASKETKENSDKAVQSVNQNIKSSKEALLDFRRASARELEAMTRLNIELLLTDVDSLMLSFGTDEKTDFGPAQKALADSQVMLRYADDEISQKSQEPDAGSGPPERAKFLNVARDTVDKLRGLLAILQTLADLRSKARIDPSAFDPKWDALEANASRSAFVGEISEFRSGFDLDSQQLDRFADRANAFLDVAVGMCKEKQYRDRKPRNRELEESAQGDYQRASNRKTRLRWLASFNLGHAEALLADRDANALECVDWHKKSVDASLEALHAADDPRRASRAYNNLADSNYKIAWWYLRHPAQASKEGVAKREIKDYLDRAREAIGRSINMEDAPDNSTHHATNAEILTVELLRRIDGLGNLGEFLAFLLPGAAEQIWMSQLRQTIDPTFEEIEHALMDSKGILPRKFIREKSEFLENDATPYHLLLERLRKIKGLDAAKYEKRLLNTAGYKS